MRRIAQEPDLIQPILLVLALVVVVGLGLAVIAKIRRALHPCENQDNDLDLLDSLQDAFAAGEIDETEYRSAREALSRATGAPPPLPASPPINDPSGGSSSVPS